MGAHKTNPFARGNQAEPPAPLVKDRLGRYLHVGDLVMAPSLTCPVVTVVDVAPILDPKAPPNHLRVVVQMTVQMLVQRGATLDLVRVQSAAEQGLTKAVVDAAAGKTDEEAAADGEPEKASTVQLTD